MKFHTLAMSLFTSVLVAFGACGIEESTEAVVVTKLSALATTMSDIEKLSLSQIPAQSPHLQGVRMTTSEDGLARFPSDAIGTLSAYGPYNIRAAHSGKCMDVTGGTGANGNGVLIQQYQCLGSRQTNQQWYFSDTGDGSSYYLIARHSNKCLDVTGGVVATGDSTPLQQFQCLGYAQSNQRWYLTTEDGYTVSLHAAHSDSCADVTGGTSAKGDGVTLQQYRCLGYSQSNQRWLLTAP